MLVRLVRTYLVPYKGELAAILVLQLIGTISALYLPTLNADIIDNGVAKGDTGYIIRPGAWMLGVSLVQIVVTVAAVYLASRVADGDGARHAAAIFHRVVDFSAQEVSKFGAPTLISRNTNDVTQVQMVVFMALAILVSTPIMMVGGIIMALREDVPLSARRRRGAPAGLAVGLVIRKMVPRFRLHADLARQRQPGHARADHRHPRRARLRARGPRGAERFAEANATLTSTGLHVGRLHGARLPDRHAHLQPLDRRPSCGSARHRIESGDMQIGSLTAFLAYLSRSSWRS